MHRRFQRAILAISIFAVSTAQSRSSEFLGVGGSIGADESSRAVSVNSTGDFVVGTSVLADGSHAFRWTPSEGTQYIDSMRTAEGVSADGGVVVGSGLNSDTGIVEPAKWTSLEGVRLLGGPPEATLDDFTTLFAASVDGEVIVGQTKVNAFGRAFLWSAAEGSRLLGFEGPADDSISLGVSDDGKVVVGVWDRRSDDPVGFRWTAENGVTLLESPALPDRASQATDVSPDGMVVVGDAWTFPDPQSPSSVQAFRWTEAGGMSFLTNSIGGWSTAFGASQSGDAIVGTAGVRAFVWTEARGMERLQDVLGTRFGLGAQLAGWTLYEAQDISADGRTIVGSGLNPNGQQQAWVARLDRPIFIPEPGSVGLTALGMLLVLSGRRRR